LGQQLHDCQVGVAVHHQPGQVIGFAEDKPRRVGIVHADGFAPRDGRANAVSNQKQKLRTRNVFAAHDHPQADLRGRRIHRRAQQILAAVEHAHQFAGRDLGGLQPLHIGLIDPEMSLPQAVSGTSRDDDRMRSHCAIVQKQQRRPKAPLLFSVQQIIAARRERGFAPRATSCLPVFPR
jgi:hypothetical protein